MRERLFISFITIIIAVQVVSSVAGGAEILLASYEPSEPNLTVTSPDGGMTVSWPVSGGVGQVPMATQGDYVLKMEWAGESDGKVEIKHQWTGSTFDLDGYDWIFIDVYMTTDLFAGTSNGLVGIWDGLWNPTWYQAVEIPQSAGRWFTLLFDVSGNTQTGLNRIAAFLFENMSTDSGTVYIDNIRLTNELAFYRYPEDPLSVEPGLDYERFDGEWASLPDFDLLTPDDEGLVSNFDISNSPNDLFGMRFSGYVDVPTYGTYTFYTQSDDGSELYIGNMLVVDNDGIHTLTEESGSITLEAGMHAIIVNFFEYQGPAGLTVSYEGPGIVKAPIGDDVLFRDFVAGDLDYNEQVNLADLALLSADWLDVYAFGELTEMAGNWLGGVAGVVVRDGWYYIGGEKFFVKGIGYEPGSRPGQYPWSRIFEPDVITFDMNRIIDAGFNTIRIWGALYEEELQLVQQMGLKILFGLWLDPHGDFGSPSYIATAENDVRNVLAYSKNYDCIIAYIIMNEPHSDTIYNSGATETVSLWTRIKNIINQEHPGVPVSYANTGVGDFINMNMFDLSGYNMYPYNPATISHSLGYQGHVDYLKKAAPNKPLVVTEFGLSVSPDGPGNYGYGGNTLQEQMDGDLQTYRALIDGGAQGGCVFNYLDGWWKNFETEDDADTHEPEPEEWFGLFGIDDESSDPNGTARPVWYAMKEYNMGIVTSPKNGEIYSSQVPLEVFCDPRVDSIRITMGPNTLYAENTGGKYISDTLSLNIAQTKKDVNLLFEFFDANSVALKTENIIFLYAQSEPILPTLELDLLLANLNNGSVCPIEITVENQSDFAIRDNTVDYVFYPHLDWQPGEERSHVLNLVENTEQFADSYTVPSQTVVLTVSAGFTIQYGEFEKRIYALKTIQKGNWANPICHRTMRY